MDPYWSSSPWVVIMSLAMGIGAATAWWIALRIWEKPKIPNDMAAVRDQLEMGANMVIRKNIELMEAVRYLADTAKSLPPEYLPVAMQVMRLAKIMEEATFEEGANEGLFPRPMFNANGPPSNEGIPIPGSPQVPQQEPPPPQSLGDNVVPLTAVQTPPGEWINGQLLRTG